MPGPAWQLNVWHADFGGPLGDTVEMQCVSTRLTCQPPTSYHPQTVMSIIRGPRRTGNFYVLDKTISEDVRLTWAARGLLIYLLGKPDHWRVSPAALRNETINTRKPTGRDGVYALLDELMQAGYVVRTQERSPTGLLGETNYFVSENANPQPLPALPDTVEPFPAKTTQVRTEGSKDLKKGRKEGKTARKTPPAPRPAPAAPSPSSFENEQPEQPAAPAPVADTLTPLVAHINAQRANNGKQPYTPADVTKLREQAAQAGISAEQAAQWVLERPTRNFFQSSYYTVTTPTPTPPAPAPTPAPPAAATPEQLAENKRIADEHLAKIWNILQKPRKH